MKKILICFGMASAAPTLTFDRPTATKKDIAFNPFNSAGKDFVQDYESKDGNYKYHAEVHYANDDNKDGQATGAEFSSFSSFESNASELLRKEIGSFDSLFQNLDSLMNDPSGLFGPNLFDRVFNDGNDEIIEEIQGSGDSTPMLFF
jgi:hypothetical protein